MVLPDWTPELVAPILQDMDRRPLPAARRVIFERLVNDQRMLHVYTEWLRRDRKTSNFLHPATNSSNSPLEAQLGAIRQVLQLVVSAASDRMAVSTPKQIEETKRHWLEHAARLRVLAGDLELAVEHGTLGLDDPASREVAPHDISALRRIASWLENLTLALRPAGDPLMIDRDRGDPVAKGVQVMIGVKMEEQFGERLDGTAATLTSIALETEATPRVSRSALAKKKTS
jgi:hypothetical protein